MKKLYFILIALLFSADFMGIVRGQDLPSSRQVSSAVYFPIGKSVIDPQFEGNDLRLSRFISSLRTILADSNYVVRRIQVVGTASPDGDEARNLQLAGARAQSLAAYICQHIGVDAELIEIVNGGENWTGLRAMIEASRMPYQSDMLRLMDRYPDDRNARKHAMQYFANSKPWLWMYENFFSALRMGGGGTQVRKDLSRLSVDNWSQLRRLIEVYPLDNERKRALLDAVDQEPDAARRMVLLREISGSEEYNRLQEHLLTGLLSESSVLSSDNWTLLQDRIAADTVMPGREQVLEIINRIPAAQGREQHLQSLNQGRPYAYIKEHYFPELLVCTASPTPEVYLGAKGEVSESTLSAENWKRLRAMIWVSEMPGKASVLEIIDATPNTTEREAKLRMIDGGAAFRYIQAVFFPELLYGISPTAQQNWERLARQVEESDMENKTHVLKILRTTPARLEREEALRALDNGQTWNRLSESLMSELLLSTDAVQMTGSGVSFYYELSPRNRWYLREPSPSELAVEAPAAEVAPEPVAEPTHVIMPDHKLHPVLALKTDLLLWGGVMPGFEMGTWTPNFSAEIYFARRWSVEAGYAYSNWNALSGGKGLYALSVANLEMRAWFGKASFFKGFYLGIYGQYGQYDIQQGVLGHTGSFWNAGLGAGYLLPLSRHWALEAEVRGGYRSADNSVYDIEPEHNYFNRTQTEGKFVPAIRVNLVYRIGRK